MNSFLETVGWTLLHSVWEFLLIGLAVWGIAQTVCATARVKYLIWCSGLAAIMIAPLLTFALLTTTPSKREVVSHLVGEPNSANDLREAYPETESASPIINLGRGAARSIQDEPETGKQTATQVSSKSQRPVTRQRQGKSASTKEASATFETSWFPTGQFVEPFLPAMVLAWMIGVTLLSTRTLLGMFLVRQLRQNGCTIANPQIESMVKGLCERMSIAKLVKVVESTSIAVPAVTGYFQPFVLLPASIVSGLPANQLQAILAHELAHIRRHDYMINLWQTVVEAFFFYHPAVWWISSQIRQERENCCDDIALEFTEGRTVYAKALLNLEEYKGQSPATVVAASGGSLLMRIRRLAGVKPGSTAGWPGGLIVLFVLAFASCSPFLLEAFRKTEAEQPAYAAQVNATEKGGLFDGTEKETKVGKTEKQDNKTFDGSATVSGKIQLPNGKPAEVQGLLAYQSVKPGGKNSASGNAAQPTNEFSSKVSSGEIFLVYYAKGYAPVWTEKFELADDETKEDITLVLKEGFTVPLSIVSQSGSPVANATIVAHPVIHQRSGGPVYKHKSNMAGKHLLKHVANTKYTFQVNAPGYQPLRTKPMDVEPAKEIELELVPCRPSTGVVRDHQGRLVKGAKIRALEAIYEKGSNISFGSDGDGFWGTTIATTNSQGEFNLDQLHDDAHYLLVVEGPNKSRVLVRDVQAGQKDLKFSLPKRLDLEVQILGDVEHLRLANRKFARLSVRQRVKWGPIGNHVSEALVGGYSDMEQDKGARYIYPGLLVDPDSTSPQQMRVSVRGMTKTIEVNSIGVTKASFQLNKKNQENEKDNEEEKLSFRGIDLNEFPQAENFDRDESTCFVPLPNEYSIYYEYQNDQFFVRRDLARKSDKQVAPEIYKHIYYGPISGNPVKKLDLKPYLLEAVKNRASSARLAMSYMVRSDNKPLIETGLELLKEMLLIKEFQKEIKKGGRQKLAAEMNLDFAMAVLNKHRTRLRAMKVAGLDEFESAIEQTEALFDAAMPQINDASYNEAGYLQKDLPDDKEIVWGEVQNGMRVGVIARSPFLLQQGAESVPASLYLQNKSDKRVYFHLEGHFAEWVRVTVWDKDKKEVPTEYGDIMISIPGFPIKWKLDPGEKLMLCDISLETARSDAKVKNSGIRGWKKAKQRIRANTGHYTCQFNVPVNLRRGIRSKGEWFGNLKSKAFNVQILSTNQEAENKAKPAENERTDKNRLVAEIVSRETIGKSDLVVTGTIKSVPSGESDEQNVVNYAVDFEVNEIIYGKLADKKLRVNIVRFEEKPEDKLGFLKKDSKVILLLVRVPKQIPQWQTISFKNGVQILNDQNLEVLKHLAKLHRELKDSNNDEREQDLENEKADDQANGKPPVPVESLIKDLRSNSQEIRDEAARQLRKQYKAPSAKKWDMMVAAIEPGMTKEQILKLFGSRKPVEELGKGTGQQQLVHLRLDELWILSGWYNVKDKTLIRFKLEQKMKNHWVQPEKDFSGVWTCYYPNGQPSHRVEFKDGKYNGIFTSYHSNGKKSFTQNYVNHVVHGKDTGYFFSGELMYEAYYDMGRVTGTWVWYNKDKSVRKKQKH